MYEERIPHYLVPLLFLEAYFISSLENPLAPCRESLLSRNSRPNNSLRSYPYEKRIRNQTSKPVIKRKNSED